MPEYLNNILRLEVDTSSPRNPLVNPSGVDGNYGWGATFIGGGGRSFAAVSGSTSPVAEDGCAFRTTVSFINISGDPFQVQAGTYLHVWLTALQTGTYATPSLDIGVSFVDAAGVATAPTYTTSTPTATAAVYGHKVLVPAGAVTARLEMTATTGSTSEILFARVGARSGLAVGVAFPAYVPANWVNILGKAYDIDTEQGNAQDGVSDEITTGTLVASIADAAIDPATSTVLRRGRPIRLTALDAGVRKRVWTGFIQTADTDYNGKGPDISLTAVDDGAPLVDAGYNYSPGPSGGLGPAIAVAARAANVVPFDGYNGGSTGQWREAKDDSAKAVDWIRRACNTLAGAAWIDSSNRLQYKTLSAIGTAPQVVLSDTHADVGSLKYTKIAMSFGAKSMVNALTIKRYNLDETEDDGAKEYGPYVASASEAEYNRSSAVLETIGGDPATLAAAILPAYSTPKPFPSSVTLLALKDLTAILALTTYTPIRIKRTTPAFNEVVRVLKISHKISAGRNAWFTTITPRPLESTASATITTPTAGANTGPSDVAPPTPGILSERRRDTNFTIGNLALVAVPFDSVVSEDGVTWDTVNKRWTAPRDGRYLVTAAVHFGTSTAGVRLVDVTVNGARRALGQSAGAAGAGVSVTVSHVVKLVTGDVVAVRAYQSSGGNLDIAGDTAGRTVASFSHLGP